MAAKEKISVNASMSLEVGSSSMTATTKRPPVWMVQYNLSGLQKPRKLTYDAKHGTGWWDRSGEFGESGWNKPENNIRPNMVRRFFDSKAEADEFYNELALYRDFIKAHM